MPKAGILKFRKPLIEINKEISVFEKKRHWRASKLERFTMEDLLKVYTYYKGACAFCGLPTTVEYKYKYTGSYFIFEVPLEKGGAVDVNNLVLVCTVHKEQYKPHKRLRERIPDVDSFADLTEALIRAVHNGDGWEKIRRIKHEMNTILEELAIHSRYTVFNEDRPIRIRTAKRDNSVADLIERFAKGEDTKQDITDGLKTIHITQKYEVQK
jgi:hypothetical protein